MYRAGYRFHYDQHEKLWLFGIMIYAGRDQYSRYVTNCTVLRNKHSSSVKLACLSGIRHLNNFYPYSSQFDCGSEAASFQQHLKEVLECGDERIIKRKSIDNIVIEAWWRQLFEGVLWLFRIEGFHLIHCGILNVNNPQHLNSFWQAYAQYIQQSIDEFVSVSCNQHLVYVIHYSPPIMFTIEC